MKWIALFGQNFLGSMSSFDVVSTSVQGIRVSHQDFWLLP